MSLFARLYRLLISAATSLQSLFLLLVRLAWGFQMHLSGDKKLHDVSKVTASFTHLGIPAPGITAVFIAVLEFVGGLLFAVGLGSRLISLLFVCDMLVALATAHHQTLHSIFTDPKSLYTAAPFPYLMAALIVLFFGPGKYSIDALLTKRFARGAANPKASSRA